MWFGRLVSIQPNHRFRDVGDDPELVVAEQVDQSVVVLSTPRRQGFGRVASVVEGLPVDPDREGPPAVGRIRSIPWRIRAS